MDISAKFLGKFLRGRSAALAQKAPLGPGKSAQDGSAGLILYGGRVALRRTMGYKPRIIMRLVAIGRGQ